ADVDDEAAPPLPGSHQRVDDVVDVDEVAALASIAGQAGRLTAAPGGDESGDDAAVRPLSWPVHRRQSERGELDAPILAVRGQQVDDRLGDDAAHAARRQRALL